MLDLIAHSIKMRRVQAFAIFLTIAVSAIVLIASSLTYIGAKEGVELAQARGGSQYLVLPTEAQDQLSDSSILFTGAPVAAYFSVADYEKIAAMDGVTACTAQFYSQTLSESCCSTGNETKVIGIEESSDFVVGPLVEDASSNALEDDEVYAGIGIAVSEEGTLTILDKTYRVASRLAETGSDLDNSIVMSIDSARALSLSNDGLAHYWDEYGQPDTLVSCVLLNIDDEAGAFTKKKISNMEGLRIVERSEVVSSSQSQLDSVFGILAAVAIVMVVSSIVQMLARFYSMAYDRKDELALYRALGAPRAILRKLIAGEAGILAVAGWIVGIVAGLAAYQLLVSSLQDNAAFPFVAPNPATTIAVAAATGMLFALIVVLSTAVPLRRAGRIDPSIAMQQGDID